MAYVSHSAYRAYRHAGPRLDSTLIFRAGLIAMAVGAAIVALSGAATEGGGAAEVATLKKADRIAQATVLPAAQSATYVVDAASQTTTVQKGAPTPLSKAAPYIAAAN